MTLQEECHDEGMSPPSSPRRVELSAGREMGGGGCGGGGRSSETQGSSCDRIKVNKPESTLSCGGGGETPPLREAVKSGR